MHFHIIFQKFVFHVNELLSPPPELGAAEKDDPQREFMKNSLRNAKTLVPKLFYVVMLLCCSMLFYFALCFKLYVVC